MKRLLAVAYLEARGRASLLLLALGVGLVPVLLLMTAGPEGDGFRSAGEIALVLAALLGATAALVMGAGMTSHDLTSRRLAFYFTRPLSLAQIWGGRLLGAGTLLLLAFGAALVPASVAGAGIGLPDHPLLSSLPVGPLLAGFALCLLALLALAHVLGIALTGRPRWRLVALVAGALVTAVLLHASRRLLDLGGAEHLARGLPVVGGGVLVTALAASAAHLSRARADPTRAGGLFSLVLWGGLALTVGGLDLWSRSVIDVRPDEVVVSNADAGDGGLGAHAGSDGAHAGRGGAHAGRGGAHAGRGGAHAGRGGAHALARTFVPGLAGTKVAFLVDAESGDVREIGRLHPTWPSGEGRRGVWPGRPGEVAIAGTTLAWWENEGGRRHLAFVRFDDPPRAGLLPASVGRRPATVGRLPGGVGNQGRLPVVSADGTVAATIEADERGSPVLLVRALDGTALDGTALLRVELGGRPQAVHVLDVSRSRALLAVAQRGGTRFVEARAGQARPFPLGFLRGARAVGLQHDTRSGRTLVHDTDGGWTLMAATTGELLAQVVPSEPRRPGGGSRVALRRQGPPPQAWLLSDGTVLVLRRSVIPAARYELEVHDAGGLRGVIELSAATTATVGGEMEPGLVVVGEGHHRGPARLLDIERLSLRDLPDGFHPVVRRDDPRLGVSRVPAPGRPVDRLFVTGDHRLVSWDAARGTERTLLGGAEPR